MASFSGLRFGVSTTTISIGGVSITTSGESGQAYLNGKYQKTEAKTIEKLREALKERQWVAVKRCLFNIAEIAQKVLVDSKSEESIELAKRYATNASVPEVMRTKLLAAFASTNDSHVISWLLKQPAFKDSAKDELIQRLVDEALKKNNPYEATELIARHLHSGYSAQETASKKVFKYFFNKGDLAHSEEIMMGHFTKGYSSYEGLAQDIFDSHLRSGNLRAAENCLRKHYTKGYSSSDTLVQVLVNHLIKSHNFDEAHAVLNRNMTKGYSSHTDLEKYIMWQEIAFLKSAKKNVKNGKPCAGSLHKFNQTKLKIRSKKAFFLSSLLLRAII